MKVGQTLASIALTSAIILTGCNHDQQRQPKQSEYVYGTILDEAGTIVDRQKIIDKSEGALFGNDSVRIGKPTYAIKFKADDGQTYSFQVSSWSGKLDALNLAIDEGTKIRIKRSTFDYYLSGTVGKISDNELEVLGQE